MDFVKKHYEKVLFGLVLAGLVGALVFLPFVIAADKQKLDDIANGIINPRANPLPDLDLTRQASATVRVQAPVSYDFNPPNKLFNPLDWQKMTDGTLKIKNDRNSGPGAAVVTKITPLYFTLTLDAVMTNQLIPRYTIGIERQAAATRALQMKTRDFVSMGDKPMRFFTLDHVVGDPVDPDQLVFKLKDTGETAIVQKDKPFRRVDGYAADLKYDHDSEKFSRAGLRVSATLSFGGDNYTIVDIKPDEVVLLAESNQKKTSLRYAP